MRKNEGVTFISYWSEKMGILGISYSIINTLWLLKDWGNRGWVQ